MQPCKTYGMNPRGTVTRFWGGLVVSQTSPATASFHTNTFPYILPEQMLSSSTSFASSPTPLTFDRVSDGIPVTCAAHFFQKLPIEILHKFLLFLERTDLKALALVDRDCRQLARSSQFVAVTIDYDDERSIQLLGLLEAEAGLSGRSSPSLTSVLSPSTSRIQGCFDNATPSGGRALGSCIRKVTVMQWKFSATGFRHSPMPEMGPILAGEHWDERRRQALADAQQLFFHRVSRVLATLPHLSTVEWMSPDTRISRDVIADLRGIEQLQRLKLVVAGGIEDGLVAEPGGEWGLESFEGSLNEDSLTSPVSLLKQTLTACRNSVRELSLISAKHLIVHQLPSEVYSMSKLSSLSLQDVAFPLYRGSLPFGNEFGLNITDLTLNTFDFTTPTLDSESNTPPSAIIYLCNLRRLTWSSSGTSSPATCSPLVQVAILQFLGRHSDLEYLAFAQGQPSSFLEAALTLLRNTHYSLSSLRVVWEGVTIPDAGLRELGLLVKDRNLRHLWISAGSQANENTDGWSVDLPTWMVDHEKVFHALHSPGQAYISNFMSSISLQTLIITRDTYPTILHPILPPSSRGERYYLDRILPTHVAVDFFLTDQERTWRDEPCYMAGTQKLDFDTMQLRSRSLMAIAWERWHASRMQGNAMMYLKGIPSLERCFVGGLWFNAGQREDVFGLKRDVSVGATNAQEVWHAAVRR